MQRSGVKGLFDADHAHRICDARIEPDAIMQGDHDRRIDPPGGGCRVDRPVVERSGQAPSADVIAHPWRPVPAGQMREQFRGGPTETSVVVQISNDSLQPRIGLNRREQGQHIGLFLIGAENLHQDCPRQVQPKRALRLKRRQTERRGARVTVEEGCFLTSRFVSRE